MSFLRLEPAPLREPLDFGRKFLITAGAWLKWFDILYARVNSVIPSVGDDIGDAATTLTWNKSATTQVYNTAITTNRAVTLSTTGAVNGARFRVVRTAAATGAFKVNVGTGPLKALDAGTFCDVEFNGTSWILTGYGGL